MTIKPIDIVKTQEVSQYKQLQNQRYQHEQVQISKNFRTWSRRSSQSLLRPTGASTGVSL